MRDQSDSSDELRDRRARHRTTELTNPMAVISLSTGPVYQLKVRELSNEGAGIVVRPDSNLLKLIGVGQEINVRIILPRGYSIKGASGELQSRVVHITEIQEGSFKGHMVIGLSFLSKIASG